MDKRTYLNKIRLIGNYSREEKLFYFYRFVSITLTTVFYLLGPPDASLFYKLMVALALVTSAILIVRIYNKYRHLKNVIKLLVILETAGITLLLIPTGGLESPFIWYALNPVLYAARYLRPYFCWITLLFYLGSANTLSLLFFNVNNVSLRAFILQNSNILLILVLITLAVQLLSELMKELDVKAALLDKNSKRLEEVNKELETANESLEQSVNYIMALYPMVEEFNNKENRKKLPQLFADYARKLTRSPNAVFGLFSENLATVAVAGEANLDVETIKKEFQQLSVTNDKKIRMLAGKQFLIMEITTSFEQKGFVGIELQVLNERIERKLMFLAELSGMILERFHLESVSTELLIAEEQNRIANEMHDSVSQRLFAIVYALHALEATHRKLSDVEITNKLVTIKGSAHSAIQELRATIHQLSISKRKEKPFRLMVERFLEEQTKLYNVKLDLKLTGDETRLSHLLQHGIYRIVCEASGNSLRHGKCKRLSIVLSIDSVNVQLTVKDDGQGFYIQNKETATGLGLRNIRRLVSSFKGKIDLTSEIGKGTMMNVNIPIGTEAISLSDYKEVSI